MYLSAHSTNINDYILWASILLAAVDIIVNVAD
jgi:hypothetical protein